MEKHNYNPKIQNPPKHVNQTHTKTHTRTCNSNPKTKSKRYHPHKRPIKHTIRRPKTRNQGYKAIFTGRFSIKLDSIADRRAIVPIWISELGILRPRERERSKRWSIIGSAWFLFVYTRLSRFTVPRTICTLGIIQATFLFFYFFFFLTYHIFISLSLYN
jgi:hypothetical protein